MTSKEPDRTRVIRQEASYWHSKRQATDFSARDEEEWQRWYKEPEHQQAFALVSSDWERLHEKLGPWLRDRRAELTTQTKTAPAISFRTTTYKASVVTCGMRAFSADAARWYAAVTEDMQQVRAAPHDLVSWMRGSPQNIADLCEMAERDRRLRLMTNLMRELRVTGRGVVALAASGKPDELYRQLHELYTEDGRPRFHKKEKNSFIPKLLAAAVVVLLGIGIAVFSAHYNPDNREIATEVGQLERVVLGDGTSLHVDGQTRLDIEFTPSERLIHLYTGNAVFDVAQDWNRPFIVRTPLADATATGTRFGVSVENSVTTTVAEGTVEIRARGQPSGPVVTLQAGKELEILTADSLAKPVDVDAQRVLEWSTGWITFGGETISQAVAEFNRRSPLRISIEDPSIVAGRKIYGRFRFDLPHSFAWSIAQHSGDITVFEDTSANVLRVRRAAMPKPLEGESR